MSKARDLGNIANNSVSSTELGYIDGVTSNIQTQLNLKPEYTAGKNAVINGAFNVWQRATTLTTSSNQVYGFADRFFTNISGTGTWSRSTDVPTGFTYSVSVAATTAAYVGITQRIESTQATPLVGQTVTLSFYAKRTVGTSPLTVQLSYANATDNFSSITLIGNTQVSTSPSSSWTRYSVTYTSISASAANGLQLLIMADAVSATNTTLYTGVQLEIGASATSFQTASGTIGGELALCQRYYYLHANLLNDPIAYGGNYSATVANCYVKFPVAMRTAPSLVSITGTGYYAIVRNGSSDFFNSFTIDIVNVNGATIYNNTEISGTAGDAGYLAILNASGLVAFSAEL